jgi:hypothetical protein
VMGTAAEAAQAAGAAAEAAAVAAEAERMVTTTAGECRELAAAAAAWA